MYTAKKSNIFISIISHNHFKIIEKLKCAKELNVSFNVIIKSNLRDSSLENYCKENNILYIESPTPVGFGENNNDVYKYCINKLNMTESDYFIVMNPDLHIEKSQILKLTDLMSSMNIKFSTINLFKDENYRIHDNSIRKFPALIDFISSFIFKKNTTIINKNSLTKPTSIDWAAGSFLVFESSLFTKLNGFDQGYFMYCEDIDICFRAKKIGANLIFFPDIKGIHLAKHSNRKVISKHFYWHLKSVFRYLYRKNRK